MARSSNLEGPIVVALRRITRAIDLHSRLLVQDCGLTAPQLATLREAARRQPVSAGALARAVSLSQPTMTGILDRLERRSLIERSRDGEDRRSVVVTVTEEGQRAVKEAPSLLQDQFRNKLAELAEWEQTLILATLQRIAAMMDAQEIDASPVLTAGAAHATVADVSGYLEITSDGLDEEAQQEPTNVP